MNENSTTSSDNSYHDIVFSYNEKLHIIVYYTIRYFNAIIGIVGNTMTLIILKRLKSLSNGHILMAYLAFTDVLVSCIIPLSTAATLTRFYSDSYGYWKTLCIVKEYVFICTMTGCFTGYIIMSVDRYVLVLIPEQL